LQGEADQVDAAGAAGLGSEAVHPGADGAHGEAELFGDLSVGVTLGDQDDQFLFLGAELAQSLSVIRRLARRAPDFERSASARLCGQAHADQPILGDQAQPFKDCHAG
jgi:hypothetical protein